MPTPAQEAAAKYGPRYTYRGGEPGESLQPIPSRLAPVGGAGQKFQFTWRGGRVLADAEDAIAQAMADMQARVANRLRRELHRYEGHKTHKLADESYARVVIRSGRRVLEAGSYAPYTVFHELGTSRFEGHPQIRTIMDQEIPNFPRVVRAKFASAGL